MAYQKIGTPVFWIDTLQFLQSMGVGGPFLPTSDIFGLNPTSYPQYNKPSWLASNYHSFKWFSWGLGAPMDGLDSFDDYTGLNYDNINIGNIDYMAYLNHNLASTTYTQMNIMQYGWEEGAANFGTNVHPVFGQARKTNYISSNLFNPYVNNSTENKADSDGYSISTLDLTDVKLFGLVASIKSSWNTEDEGNGFGSSNQADVEQFGYPQVGCISIGKRYQMPSSPDLNLTQTYDYAVKEIKTKGGESLTENMWKNPKWGELGAWELASVTNNEVDQNAVRLSSLARSGRKVYDLSFSYLDDGDVFGANQTLSLGDNAWSDIISGYEYGDDTQTVDGNEQFTKNILNDSSFFTSVIHKTNGGQLPFIFQPNSEDKTNMVIAKLDMKSFSFRQVASNLYNISLKIREVW